MPSQPRGRPRAALITLLTDFGYLDPYVGIMKGVILGINPRARLVDLTHGIAPQAVMAGAFALDAAWPYFPDGTLHVAVVDPGVGTARAPIAVSAGGQVFIGPDNGIFSRVLARFPEAEVRRIDASSYRLPRVSYTFHGRDIFAPAAAWLSRGVPLGALGPVHDAPVRLEVLEPRQAGRGWEGRVVYVDGFGNLVTNLGVGLIGEDLEGWRVSIAGRRAALVRTFGEGAEGALVALVGSFGVVEVAVNGGSAREVLGAGEGAGVRLERG